MDEKEDGLGLNLTLSLKCPENLPPPLPLNLHTMFKRHKSSRTTIIDAFRASSPEGRSYLRGTDVNRPVTVDCEEVEVGVSSPNSTISSVSGKRGEREEINEEEDGGDAARKKLRLSKEQSAVLEETFKEHNTLNPKQKVALAQQLNLRPRQVEVWFQNRRARTKLKQTEVDCEYLKRCCENLTQENRRLQKEVNELRALKLSPQSYMNMKPPTTLTMCPSCVAVLPTSSSAAASSTTTPTAATGDSRQIKPVGPQHQRSIPIHSWVLNSHKPQAA